MRITKFIQPNVSVLGYALFLALNATVLWGGVFPFLPELFQTSENIFAFFAFETTAFGLTHFVLAAGAYSNSRFFINATKGLSLKFFIVTYFLGWACIIASMYLESLFNLFIALSGILLGISTAGFCIAWQQLFSGLEEQKGSHHLILAIGYSALIYLALYLIPTALTCILIPLVFLPLFCLCAALTRKKIDFSLPMFSDAPRDHPNVYRHAITQSVPSIICIGTIALCCGIVRSLAIESVAQGELLNIASMGACLVMSILLLSLWKKSNVSINIVSLYRILFPIIITAFFLIIILGSDSFIVIGGGLHSFYACATMLIMLQCIQISRDSGINPVFLYGLLGGFVSLMYDTGFLIMRILGEGTLFNLSPYIWASVLAMWVVTLVFFFSEGGFGNKPPQSVQTLPIELLATDTRMQTAKKYDNEPTSKSSINDSDGSAVRDRLSKQCFIVQAQYGLSSREREIIDLLARGCSATSIGEKLYLSENTVKTHMRRVYAKLGIHKKSDLIELINKANLG